MSEEDFEWESNRRTQARALAVMVNIIEPQSYKEAMASVQSKEWEKAMKEEYEALMRNETWELSKLPNGQVLVGCHWVFRLKCDSKGKVVRYKARLVAKGFGQHKGLDYNETFAPVAKFTSIHTLLALAAANNWEVDQMDVKSAFLNRILKEEIFMDQPEGFEVGDGTVYYCRMR
jgi:hypothetical protein